MSDFPLDETTLTLLEAACRINPDSGHSELQAFLGMTAGRVVSEEWVEPDVLVMEYAPGEEPHSVNSVILALIAEIRRGREAARVLGEEER